MKWIWAITILAGLAIVVASWKLTHSPASNQLRSSPGDGSGSPGESATEPSNGGGPASSSAGTGKGEWVTALGRLEPAGGVIQVGAVAGNRIQRVLVAEGQYVKKGAKLAELQSLAALEAEKALLTQQIAEAQDQREADLAYSGALVAEARIAVDQPDPHPLEIETQRGKVKMLETRLKQETKELQRAQKLLSISAAQDLERQELAVYQTQEELNGARLALIRMQEAQKLNEKLAYARLKTAEKQQGKIDIATRIDSLQKQLNLAELKAAEAVILAPADGLVLEITGRAGELTGQKPILKMGDTQNMTAVAEVYETEVHQVVIGQPAFVTSPALRQSLDGNVASVSALVSKNDVLSLDPSAKTDARVVEVVIKLKGLKDHREAARLVNLQVSVRIDVRKPATKSGGAQKGAPAKRGHPKEGGTKGGGGGERDRTAGKAR